MSILDKIKAIIQNFKNRNIPKLEESRNPNSYRPTHSSRQDFVRKTREGVSQPEWNSHEQFINTQSVRLVNQNRKQSQNQIRYTGSRTRRLNSQNRSQAPNLKLRIAAIAASAILATSCVSACIHRGYDEMTLSEIQECLSNENISNEDLLQISNALENDGLDIVKDKISDAFDLKPDKKNDMINLIVGNEYAPTSINVLGQTYRSTQGIGVVDKDRADIISDGITAVINSTGRLQDETNPASRTELKHYVEQLKALEEAEVTISPNTYSGKKLSADYTHEPLLVQYSIDSFKTNNTHEIDTDFEIGD